MATVVTHKKAALGVKSLAKEQSIWEAAEFNRFAISIVAFAFVGILSAIAGAYAVEMGLAPLALVVFPAMFTLSTILAVAPIKTLFGVAGLSFLINMTIIMFNLFA